MTPPEFGHLRLAGSPFGRIGGLRLRIQPGVGGASLAEHYQQVPLRVLPPFPIGEDGPALLYLLNPTAGLMDGDGQLVQADVAAGAAVLLAGQSATRLHPGLRGFSTQQWLLRVQEGGILIVLPGPAIPYEGCRYYQRVRVDLARGANLVWGDIWFSGRYARGLESEQFRFDMLIQDLAVRRQGHLIYRDRFSWRGPWNEETARWHFGPFPACASLFVTGDRRFHSGRAAPHHAQFLTVSGETCFRWCGPSEQVVSNLVQSVFRIVPQLLGKRSEGFAQQVTNHLAPNHWFMPSGTGV